MTRIEIILLNGSSNEILDIKEDVSSAMSLKKILIEQGVEERRICFEFKKEERKI